VAEEEEVVVVAVLAAIPQENLLPIVLSMAAIISACRMA